MDIYIETIKNNDNYISFNQYNFYEIPFLAFKNYFCNSKENIYFLILAFFSVINLGLF